VGHEEGMGEPRARFPVPRFPVPRFPLPRFTGFLAAVLLGVGLSIAPVAATPVAAADPLQVSADATYTLDPGAGRVHVLVRYQVKDRKPDSAQFTYFYTGYRFAIQREARSVRASDSGGALSIETRDRPNYVELTVDFRRDIHYGETARFDVRYDLVGGAPRSASVIRVGRAFATWGVWAWGDPGRGSVVVKLPAGFRSSIDGDAMATDSAAGRETLSASPATPEKFFAIVSAENEAAYTEDRLSLGGGVEIVVMAWPQDADWDDLVITTLRTAMPELRDLIGLDWPVTHDLDVRERYTPALEGYAGVFFTNEKRIDISEDLDPVTIVHEASHAWLNEDLFTDRWIYEGLAQEYAWRALRGVGAPDGGLPARPAGSDRGSVKLEDWSFPQVIRDQQTDDTERFGYEASFWVVHHIVDAVGADGMRTVFAAAHAHSTAYPGAGKPEPLIAKSDWQHFLDLLENADAADAADFEATLREWVLPAASTGLLDQRRAARQAYRDLVAAGNGWLPGWFVRRPMGLWQFDAARKAITEATGFLALRGQVDAAVGAVGVTPDGALRAAYETAASDLGAATALANEELAALAAIADAKARVDTEPDLVSRIGLVGAFPQAPYDAARVAFERGDMAGAKASATEAAAIVTGAATLGQERLAIGIAIAVALLLLLAALIVLRRRRRRRAGALVGTTAGVAATTLAADPDTATPSTSGPSPELEGGAVHGGPPADSESPSA
jgi:hypothetical protein